MDRDSSLRQRSVARELRVETEGDWTSTQPSPRRVATAPSSPSTAYTTDREATFRSGNATVSETHVIRSSGSQSQSYTEEHWSSEITSFVATAPPKFIQVIKAYRILNSDTPTLVVEVASEPPAIFEWFCNDKPVMQDKRRFQTRHGLNITTLTINKPEQGVYKCTARNPAGCSTSYGYITVNFEHRYEDWNIQEKSTSSATDVMQRSITYHHAPRFTSQVPNLTVPPGSEAVIDVEVDADPPARFSWFVNGKEFRDSADNVELFYPKDNRCVARFSIPVSGQYKVVASNLHGSAMSSGYVEIYQAAPARQARPPMPPGEHLARSMMTSSQHTGQMTGTDTAAVTSTQTMSVYEVNYAQRSSSVPRGVRHLEKHVEVATAAPETKFMSSSARNSRIESFEMVAPDLPEESAPKIIAPLHSMAFMDGQPMVLRCQIKAVPSAAVEWTKDDVNVEEWIINKDVTTQILPDGVCELVNPEAFPEDSGLYKCLASNPYGTAETSAYISVEPAEYKKDKEEASMSESFASELHPTVGGQEIILPPKFVEPLLAEVDGIEQLNYIRLVCRVVSVGPVIIVWRKDDQLLDTRQKHEFFEFEDGTQILTIYGVTSADNGVYTCSAESDHGLATTSTEVVITRERKESPIDTEIVEMPTTEAPSSATQTEITVQKPPPTPTDEVIGVTEIRKNEEEFKLLVKVADSVASTLVANVFVDAVREAARRIIEEESSEEEELEAETGAPRFDTSVEEYVAMEGSPTKISISVSGYPTPFVEWYYGENKLKVTENLSMSYEKGVASLNLKNVQFDHAGTYYLQATNPHGTTVLSTKLKVVPKQAEMNIRTSLAKYDKVEADEKVVTNVFANQPGPVQQQEINVMIKRSDSQTFTTKEEDFEMVKKEESGTPPDFEVVQMEEAAPPVEQKQDVSREEEAKDEEVGQQEIPVIVETPAEEAMELQQTPERTKEETQDVPKIIVPEDRPVPAPRAKELEAQAAEQPAEEEQKAKEQKAQEVKEEQAQPIQKEPEVDAAVKEAAEKFAESFTEKVLSQAQDVVLTAKAKEESQETQVIKTLTTVVLDKEEESSRRSVTVPYEETIKTIENRLEAAASPELSTADAVNMVMETVMSLKKDRIFEQNLTVDARNPDGRFDHVVTVVEPEVLQLNSRISAMVPQLKFIDMDTILQRPGTSQQADCLLPSLSRKNANAEHRVIVLEGASQNFHDAMKWSLRKVQQLADDEQTANANVEVVRPPQTNSEVTAVVEAEKIIPDLLQVAAAANKLKLENVTVSLVKRGDSSHTQLVIEYESQVEDEADLNESHLEIERPTENKEEMWSRRSRFSEEDERVAAVFVEVDAVCPDQNVEIIATVNMPLETTAEQAPIAVESLEHSQSVTETSGALQPPKFFRQLADNQAVVGHPVQFKCIVSGTPTPQIIWSVDGDVIEPNHEYNIVYEDGVSILKINDVVSEDEGEYWCEAVNAAGRASTKCFLKVLNVGWPSGPIESASDPDSTDIFEWEERRIQELIDRENALLASLQQSTVTKEAEVSPCIYNEDLKEISAFHKYFETAETAVLITELYELGAVEGTVKAATIRSRLQRVSSTSTTDAEFHNKKKNSFCVAATRLEKQSSKERTSMEGLWDSEFNNPFGPQSEVKADESKMYEPRTPLLPVKMSYKGQKIDVSVNEVEKEEKVVNEQGEVEIAKKTCLETSLKFNSPLNNPKKISTKKHPAIAGPEIVHQIDELKAETNALMSAMRRAELELQQLESLRLADAAALADDVDEPSNMSINTSEAELIDLLRKSQTESLSVSLQPTKEVIAPAKKEENTEGPKSHSQRPPEPQPAPSVPKEEVKQEEPKKVTAPSISVEIAPKAEKGSSLSPKKTDANFLTTMKEIERIARSVENELAELSHSSGNELSDDAKSIEEAILMMSDRLVMQHPLTEAQAEATEELLRTTLADLILNPTRSVEEEIEIMKKPIRLLRRRISEIENSLMEDAEVQQIAEAPAATQPSQALKRVPSAELIRMTPLTSNIKDQLTVLEDMINEHMESEATESYKAEPAVANQKRKELHNIFMQINEEINTIRVYCSKKLTKKGADAVMNVLEKVKTHVTSIVNVMNLAKKKRIKHTMSDVTETCSFVKHDTHLEVDGIMTFKQRSMETSSLHQSSTQRSSAAVSTASDDTWKYSKNDRSTRASSEAERKNGETMMENTEHTPVPDEPELPKEPEDPQVIEVPAPRPPPRRMRTTSADPRLEEAVEEHPVPPPRLKKHTPESTLQPEEKNTVNREPKKQSSLLEKAASLERKNFFMRKTSSERASKATPEAPPKPKRSFADGALGLFKSLKNPLKKKEKKKGSEEYEPLVNEQGLDEERSVLQFNDESNLLDELRLFSRENRDISMDRYQSPIYDEVARSVSADRMRHYMPPGVTETCVDDYDEELNLEEQMPQEATTNAGPVVPPHQSKLPDKWSEEEIHTSYAATRGVDFFGIEGAAKHALITMLHPQVYSADYSVGMDDTNSVQMLCEESDYATDTDTSCMLRGSVHVFRASPLISQAPPIAKIMEESFEGEFQEVMVNVELTSVDMDDAQDEAQFSFAEMLVYESDLDSEAVSEKPKSETQVSETRSDKTAINPIEEAQISEMFSSSQTVEEQEAPAVTGNLRETDILSDESLRTDPECHVTAYFNFTKVPSKRKIIAQVSQEVFQSATVSIAENLFEVIIEQEPENLGLIIKITEDLVDYTSLTVFSPQDDEISESHPYYLDPNTDFTETSSFDEYEGDDTRTGINVSIIARSLHDSIYASLEEIPWGEVAMNLKENDLCKSVDTSLQFNVTVSENADERKSLRSQPSLRESQNSIPESNTLSNTSINIPSYVIKLGSTATITCELNNYMAPNSKIEWVKGKKLVVKTPGKFDRISHDLLEVLIINNVDYSDNELYSLKVNNDIFPVAFLLVEDSTENLPSILTPPQTQFVMEGQPTEIPVQVTKNGQEVIWFKDKKPLANSMRQAIGFSENFSKVIFSETRTSDQGTYVAMLGEQAITITLVVEERIDEKEVTVVASGTESEDDDIQEYLVPPGSTATIACELEESDNHRSLLWIRDGRPLMFNQSHKLEHVVNGLKHYLVIRDTGISDSGLYSVSISGTEFRVAHLVVNDLATSIQSHRRKRISNVSLNK